MSDTVVYTDSVININASAYETYIECMATIADAYHKWASDHVVALRYLDSFSDKIDFENAEKELVRRKAIAIEMELSFLRNWGMLTGQRFVHDGQVHIFRDGFCSFLWRYDSGYHGGLIFHRNHQVKDNDKIGTWSIHT